MGLIAGLTVPSIVISIEKSKRQALLKEGFQTISSIVQAGYLNGDFANITSWDIVNQKGAGSIVDYFNQKLNAAYRCNTNDTTTGCGRNQNTLVWKSTITYGTVSFPLNFRPWNSSTEWNHNGVWILPSGALFWMNSQGQINANGMIWSIASDAYATDVYLGGESPSMIHFFCNLTDTPSNTVSVTGVYNVKPGMCSYIYGGLGN